MIRNIAEIDLASEASQQAIRVMNWLPPSNYAENFQPDYSDPDLLEMTLNSLHLEHRERLPTTPDHVEALQARLAGVADEYLDTPIIIAGRCSEPVGGESVLTLAEQSMQTRAVVLGAYGVGGAIYIDRSRGQNTKPRSNSREVLPDGRTVQSYMGDAVNGRDPANRTPDPTRMLWAAKQAYELEKELSARAGAHVPAAHEALLLPYEYSNIRLTPRAFKEYLLSADLPWIGKRTNDPDGAHVKLLSTVNNPVGVKIGADSTPEHIAALATKLNPQGIPGKLTFMLRTELRHEEQLKDIVDAVKAHAPESLLVYDVHGVTRTNEYGEKVRCVPEIIADIYQKALVCRAGGMALHGLHLETIADDSRLECTDEPDQRPTHPGNVDPQLNLRQLRRILDETKDYLLAN